MSVFVTMIGTIVGPDGLLTPNAITTVRVGEPLGRDFKVDRILAVADSAVSSVLRANAVVDGSCIGRTNSPASAHNDTT